MASTVDPADPGGAARLRRGAQGPAILRLGTVVSTQDEASTRLVAGERPPFARACGDTMPRPSERVRRFFRRAFN